MDISAPECAADQGSLCQWIWDTTGIDALAANSNAALTAVLHIVLILITALIVRFIVYRSINRLTRLTIDGKVNKNRGVKTSDHEKPRGEWNTIEVICDGDKIINIVNGVVVNEGSKASVTKGKLVLQSEGAEVFYRKVELTPLKK